MIISTIQKYLIAILLTIIVANAGVSIYYKFRSDRYEAAEQTAKQATETAKKETQSVRDDLTAAQKANEILKAEVKAAREAMLLREQELNKLNKQKEQRPVKNTHNQADHHRLHRHTSPHPFGCLVMCLRQPHTRTQARAGAHTGNHSGLYGCASQGLTEPLTGHRIFDRRRFARALSRGRRGIRGRGLRANVEKPRRKYEPFFRKPQ